MRVVFLTHNYPRHADDVAGAFLHPLATALVRRGADVRVVAPSDRGKGGRDVLDGVPVRRVRYGSARAETLAYSGTMMSAIKTPGGLRSLAGLYRALRRGAEEELAGSERGVVHAHWWFPAGAAAPHNRKLVITCHGTDVRLLEANVLLRWFGGQTLRRADVVTTVSRPWAESIERTSGVMVGPERVQPMPVVAVERPWSTGGGGIIVLGRLSEQKRVGLALAGYAHARQHGLRLPLRIVGDGPARGRLEALGRELGLGDVVRFVGEVAPREVPGFLATADCCLMTAQSEGLGLTAAEALMQGVPVIACRDGGGVLDVVPGEGGGRIVEPGAQAVGEALLDVLASPDAKPAAVRAGGEWRARLSPDHVAERCLAWYEEALHG